MDSTELFDRESLLQELQRSKFFFDDFLLVVCPRVVAIADPWTVEPGASAFRFLAAERFAAWVVVDVLVLAAAAQDPRAFCDHVEKRCACTFR